MHPFITISNGVLTVASDVPPGIYKIYPMYNEWAFLLPAGTPFDSSNPTLAAIELTLTVECLPSTCPVVVPSSTA